MGVRERRAREKRYLRQEIMDAASELFVKEGFENVSMRRIADRVTVQTDAPGERSAVERLREPIYC